MSWTALDFTIRARGRNARRAGGALGPVGFALFSFEFGKTEGGRVNYISNGGREDMIAAVKEWLARAEDRMADVPRTRQ
ncbi:MAG: hypothetical protein V4514_19880 [Pseudomonadota bacterium]|uniref:hypothetical protein n=1 Tax=Phenylobacterium sp. TaxID=1871053 RepID=UPI0025D35ACE|nr:hypothetical protein [Phenylobacterium sp.]MBT9472101.1 hypothetical protein [Phenylobacterium sp.]